MNLHEYQEIICATYPEDWTYIPCWGANSGPSFLNKYTTWESSTSETKSIEIESHSNVISLKSDLLISAAWGLECNEDFREPWANAFPDPSASSGYIDFFYSGHLVYRDTYVSVDGGRVKIPLPDAEYNKTSHLIEKLTISQKAFDFFRMLNRITSTHDYERYIRDAKIEIIDTEWLS